MIEMASTAVGSDIERKRKSAPSGKRPPAGNVRPRNGAAQQTRHRRKKKKSKTPLIITVLVLLLIIIVGVVYAAGFLYYKDRFTANVYINSIDVSGKTFDQALQYFKHSDIPENIEITTPQNNTVSLSLAGIDYKYSYEEELKKIYDDIDRKSWFAFLMHRTDYGFKDVASYDRDKLMAEIDAADWGHQENVNAQLKSGDDGYYVVPEVQGDVFDMDTLKNYITANLDSATYTLNSYDSGAYVTPETVTADYDKKAETLNRLWNISISYDFNYTTETLTGKKLVKLVDVDREGNYTVDSDACMDYIEKLAKKYDTYNTTRKFNATIQGKIKVKPSSDAKYGWWMDQQECCDQLVRMLKKGKSRNNVTPIYYNHDGYFEFTGVPEARSENDDIGKTYIEVDLSNQQWWYYKKGKMKRSGYIVSGQTTSAARTTLEGVYKLWAKDYDHRMKDSNADGDEWDVTCTYWNNISLCGIGMHDSAWRGGAFGGDIYKWNGSHGCINMSVADAEYIYYNIDLGTPVVMYY